MWKEVIIILIQLTPLSLHVISPVSGANLVDVVHTVVIVYSE